MGGNPNVRYFARFPGDPDIERYYAELFAYLGQWYTVVRHQAEGNGIAFGYIDSVFVRSDLLEPSTGV